MLRSNIAVLIGESPEARGVLEEATETRRTVYCTVKSIGQTEAYQAMSVGMKPDIKIVLAHDFEYQGENLAELEGVRYRILRSYATEADGIELTLERVRGNAAAPAEEPEPEPDPEEAQQGEPAVTGEPTESEPAAGTPEEGGEP